MRGINKLYCASSSGSTAEPKMEGPWSECFQDLGSWCHLPADELNTPILSNQNEFTFSFDDQSKYCKWDVSSPLELQGDMWEPADNLLSPLIQPEEDNNYIHLQSLDKSVTFKEDYIKKEEKESPIRYSGNLVLTQCSYNNLSSGSKNWKEEVNQPTSSNMFGRTSDLDQKWEDFIEIKEEENTVFKVPEEKLEDKKERPQLKLNIAAAKANSNSDIDSFSMNTPDVLKSLSEDPGFSLLSFVCESFDEPNLISVDPTKISSQEPKLVNQICGTSQQADPDDIKSDHDYTESRILPKGGGKDLFSGIVIKDEPESPSTRPSYLGKRVRRTTATSEDFAFDSDPPSDNSSDWSPSSSKKIKTKKKSSRSSKASMAIKRSRKSSESDSCSTVSGPDRYRELRDRNNEASRRSRMNRKQKEVEMLDLAKTLESDNVTLKLKASSLEKRVKALRQILMKVVLDRNSKT